jgi:hypothetical protein
VEARPPRTPLGEVIFLGDCERFHRYLLEVSHTMCPDRLRDASMMSEQPKASLHRKSLTPVRSG